MNPALNISIPSQPLATHCFQLSNMFSPNRYAPPPSFSPCYESTVSECIVSNPLT